MFNNIIYHFKKFVVVVQLFVFPQKDFVFFKIGAWFKPSAYLSGVLRLLSNRVVNWLRVFLSRAMPVRLLIMSQMWTNAPSVSILACTEWKCASTTWAAIIASHSAPTPHPPRPASVTTTSMIITRFPTMANAQPVTPTMRTNKSASVSRYKNNFILFEFSLVDYFFNILASLSLNAPSTFSLRSSSYQ